MGVVDYGEMRRKIHEAITEAISDEEIESTFLSGWNLIYEGIHPDDRRSLTYITSDATGESPLTPWAARGYMHHIGDMFFEMTDDGVDDEEEEE